MIGVSVKLRPSFLKSTTVLAGSLLIWGFQPNHELRAQGSEATDRDSPTERGEGLEEIVVTAPRTPTSMRAEIHAAKIRAVAIFNEINLENDYDIVCRRETPVGSHIPQRVCRARYAGDLESEASQDFLAGDGYFDPAAGIMYHDDILKQKLAEMAMKHPNFYEALNEYYLLMTKYEAERKARFTDNRFAR